MGIFAHTWYLRKPIGFQKWLRINVVVADTRIDHPSASSADCYAHVLTFQLPLFIDATASPARRFLNRCAVEQKSAMRELCGYFVDLS